jgi:TetR/AcrR family transcriptional regulator, transcriptional repressor for nem operon
MTEQATTEVRANTTVTTKEALLEAGTHIILEKGYNHMGIQEVLQAAGVPKGSFYYYFPSKADFGLQIIERFAAAYTRRLDQCLGDTTASPLTRLRRHLEQSLSQFESRGCRRGCLIGNLSQELADQNDVFRERLETVLTIWRERYTCLFREAQEVGELRADLDPEGLAEFYLNSFEGALLRAKVHKSMQPMRLFMTIMFDDVLRSRR